MGDERRIASTVLSVTSCTMEEVGGGGGTETDATAGERVYGPYMRMKGTVITRGPGRPLGLS